MQRGGISWSLRFGWSLVPLWLILLLWSLMPNWPGSSGAGVLQALCVIVLVGLHACLSNGWKGCLSFFIIAVVIAFMMEASSIATGFPFGHFMHKIAGPKLLGVPPHVPVGYAILGWVAWSLARLLVRDRPWDVGGIHRFTTPIVAAFILTGYDYAYEPIGSTIEGMWAYRFPSGYFGVPLTNFLGWLLTGWLFFQLFALIEHRLPSRSVAVSRRSLWLLPCMIWAGSMAQYPLRWINAPTGTTSLAGRTFIIADIQEAAAIAALLTMGFVAATATIRALAIPAFRR